MNKKEIAIAFVLGMVFFNCNLNYGSLNQPFNINTNTIDNKKKDITKNSIPVGKNIKKNTILQDQDKKIFDAVLKKLYFSYKNVPEENAHQYAGTLMEQTKKIIAKVKNEHGEKVGNSIILKTNNNEIKNNKEKKIDLENFQKTIIKNVFFLGHCYCLVRNPGDKKILEKHKVTVGDLVRVIIRRAEDEEKLEREKNNKKKIENKNEVRKTKEYIDFYTRRYGSLKEFLSQNYFYDSLKLEEKSSNPLFYFLHKSDDELMSPFQTSFRYVYILRRAIFSLGFSIADSLFGPGCDVVYPGFYYSSASLSWGYVLQFDIPQNDFIKGVSLDFNISILNGILWTVVDFVAYYFIWNLTPLDFWCQNNLYGKMIQDPKLKFNIIQELIKSIFSGKFRNYLPQLIFNLCNVDMKLHFSEKFYVSVNLMFLFDVVLYKFLLSDFLNQDIKTHYQSYYSYILKKRKG